MKKIIVVVVCLFMVRHISFAHGVHYRNIKGGEGIEVRYDDGSPMSYSEVKVYSPDDKEEVFQEGLTDRNGRFIFFPDKPGEWKVEVSDGMGHGVVTNVKIGETDKIQAPPSGHFRLWQKLLIGLSIIWGCTGFLLYLKARAKISTEGTCISRMGS